MLRRSLNNAIISAKGGGADASDRGCGERCSHKRNAVQMDREYAKDKGNDLAVTPLENDASLRDGALTGYDIIFLDIDMPHISGMETAQEIRRVNSSVLIVFVTSYQEYMRDAFRVEAFDYLVKPVNIRELNDVLKRCMAKYTQRYEQIAIKTVEKEMIALSINEILFIQSHLHHIIMVTNHLMEL